MLVFKKKQIFQLFLVLLKRTAFLAVLFLLLAHGQSIKATGFEEVCRGAGAGVCDSGLECDAAEDICLGSNGYACQDNKDCANGLSCLSNYCAVDKGEQQGEKFGLGKSTRDIRDQIRTFINIFLGFLGILGVLMVMYAGWLWMTARGNAEQVKKAHQTLTYAVLGILVILVSWTITSYILYLGSQVGGGGGGGNGGGGPPILPPEPPTPISLSLEIKEFGTQHQEDQDSQNGIYPSCGINIDFNLYVDPASVDKAKNVNLVSPLRVEKADMPGMAVRDFLTNANRVTYPPKKWIDSQGQSQTGDDLALSAKYQIVLPGILDIEEHPALKNNTLQYLLQNCQGDLQNVCNIIGNDIYWYFKTADTEEDLPKVSLASTAPADQARNVPTYPSIILKFNGELFAPSFLDGSRFKNNIKIWQTNDGKCQITADGCVAVNSPASIAENWEAYLDGPNVSFYYRPSPRAELKPFSWYYFQADNILDLCGQEIIGNVDQTSKIILRFQVGEGAKFIVYPPNDADTLCPGGVPIYAKSSISLFDPTIGNCGYNVVGSLAPNIQKRVLNVVDPKDGGCTDYQFLPISALSPKTKYTAQVSTDFMITGTEVLQAEWKFSTDTVEHCDNPPAIVQISPESGSRGQCLGIIGHDFIGKSDFTDKAHQQDNLVRFVKKGQLAGDQLADQTYNDILTKPEINGSWLDNNIVTIFPKDKFVKDDILSISMQRYSQKVDRILKTGDYSFTLINDKIITKPLCLTAIELIDPQAPALVGKKIKLTGRNFSDENLTPHENCAGKKNCVKFNNDTLITPSYYWTDVSAESSIPGQALAGANLVFVHKIINPGAQDIKSNGYLFNVDLPPPEKPQVVDYVGCNNGRFQTPSPYPNRTDVCLNTEKRVVFFLEYDRQIQIKAPLRFSVEDCGQEAEPNCLSNNIQNGNYTLTDGQVVADPNHEGLKITMTGGSLSANTWYQANLQSGIADGKDVNISADPFVWSFKTNNKTCEINKVDVKLLPTEIIYQVEQDKNNTSSAKANAIDTSTCQQLDMDQFSWNWSVKDITGESDKQIASLESDNHTVDNTVTATGADFGQTNIKTQEEKSGKEGSAVLKVTTGDSTSCDQHIPDGCEKKGLCPGSQCLPVGDDEYHCTPVVNSLSPTAGPVGAWLEINGCYFGEQRGEVNFNSEADGIFDGFPAQCAQSLWTNEKILTEAPAKNSAGVNLQFGDKAVKVITSLSLESNADQKFNLTDDPLLPQLCAVNPISGKAETAFSAIGKFNDQAINTTGISIGGKGSSGAVENKNEIKTQVAKDATVGEQVVKVIQDGKKSPQDNIKFTVLSNEPPIAPQQTFIQILNYSPKTDNVCQNATVSVEFDTIIKDADEGKITLEPNECEQVILPIIPVAHFNFPAIFSKLFKKIFGISKATEATEICGNWVFPSPDNHKVVELKYKDNMYLIKDQSYFIKITSGADGITNKAGDIFLDQTNCLQGGGKWQENPDQFCVLPLAGFSGGNTICKPDRVVINHGDAETFVYNVKYKDNPADPPIGSYTLLTATGYAGDTEINLVKPFYSSMKWEIIKKSDIISLDNVISAKDIEQRAYVVQKDKIITQGSDVVKTIVTVGEKKLTDTIIATLALCAGNSSQYFWKFTDPNSITQDVSQNRPTAGLDDIPGNFSLSYCRYRTGEPPLPLLGKDEQNNLQIVFPPVSQKEINKSNDILKEYYFKFVPEQGESDATFLQKPYAKDFFILRIMPNWEQDYLSEWFIKEQDNLAGITRPPSITKQNAVDYAYEQADGGNILFVNALNLIKTVLNQDQDQKCGETNCKMFTNVYILSYNQDADKLTQDIFIQLKNNWQFNTNFYNNEEFIIEGVTEEQIQRDWQRIRDLNLIAGALEKYKENNNYHYPLDYSVFGEDLISRAPGIAVSAWQSEWQTVLAGKLKDFLSDGIPIDPLVNKVQCQDISDVSLVPQSPECSVPSAVSKRQDYYCRPAVNCISNDSQQTCPADYCQWIGDAKTGSCQSTDKNTGTYVYQYQLTGECYRYDEVEVKCNLFNQNNQNNCKDTCVWHEPDVKEPKFRQEPGRCESICSDPQNPAFQDKANYCVWKIEDQRCYSKATAYDLYANFEYSPAPWCNAKDANHCQEYKFCHWQDNNNKCLPQSTEGKQPYCADNQKVFNVLYTSG